MYLAPVFFVVGALVVFSPMIMQTPGPRSELSLAIEEITGIILALGGIAVFFLERSGRKKEAAETKRYLTLFGQKTVEILPKIDPLYDLAKKSGQIPAEMVPVIEQKAKEVKEAANIGGQQLDIILGTMKPDEKASALIIPRETTDTTPAQVQDTNTTTPHIKPKQE